MWNYVRTSVFFPYSRTVSDTMFSSNGLDPTQLGYPLLEFAFRVHVITYCTEVSGLVNGLGVSRVGAADINSDQLSNERINHSSPKLRQSFANACHVR